MKIAVEGCAHGELDNIYDTIKCMEEENGMKIDLLICCGDFQSVRNEEDLRCMAIPPKYYNLCSFYKYYTGEKEAPVLTIFIGGNHEASNYLQELPYGGWVAPNIYYLGYAGVVNVAGIRIGGISGIYKGNDYMKGHYEKCPYNDGSKRSVYHIRNLEVFRLKQISPPLDIFLSHDWPTGVCEFGDKDGLLQRKPFFRDDIDSGKLGSKPCEELLKLLKPEYWFAAHLHCKFAALVPHSDTQATKFLALDKCLPKRRFLQIVDVPHDENSKIELHYDLEWLTILFLTNHLLSVKSMTTYMPGPSSSERWLFTPTAEEMDLIKAKFNDDLRIPKNFAKTAPGHAGGIINRGAKQPQAQLNPQTKTFCQKLGVDDPLALVLKTSNDSVTSLLDESNLDDAENTSFIEDTDVSNRSLDSLNSSMRTRLSLPEPKSDVYDSSSVCDVSLSDLKEEGAENVDVGSEFVSDDVGSDVPRPKKFIRRNANIYDDSSSA